MEKAKICGHWSIPHQRSISKLFRDIFTMDRTLHELKSSVGETMVRRYSVVGGYWYEAICVEICVYIYIYSISIYHYIYTVYTSIYHHKNSPCLNLFRVNILEPSTKPRICLNFTAITVISLPKWVLEVESHHLTSCHCSIPHTNDSAKCENTPLQFETVTRSSWSWISTWTFLRKKKHYINHMAAMINFRTKGVCITSLTVHGANSKLWWHWNLELLMIIMLILITISWDTVGMLSWRNGRTPTSGWKCWEITDLEQETTLLTMGVKPPKIWRISGTRSHQVEFCRDLDLSCLRCTKHPKAAINYDTIWGLFTIYHQ